MTSSPQRKKTGPVPARGRGRYNVILDTDLAEWGMRQPGGLSDLLRRLLAQARVEEQRPR